MQQLQQKFKFNPPLGLTQHGWKDFEDCKIKANDLQLKVMIEELAKEKEKR